MVMLIKLIVVVVVVDCARRLIFVDELISGRKLNYLKWRTFLPFYVNTLTFQNSSAYLFFSGLLGLLLNTKQ